MKETNKKNRRDKNKIKNISKSNYTDHPAMFRTKGKQSEKDKEPYLAAGITMADISLLLDQHRVALPADFKSLLQTTVNVS